MYYIYERFNPLNPFQVYIGVTRQRPKARVYQTKKRAVHKRKHNEPLNKHEQLILELHDKGIQMQCVVIDETEDILEAEDLERFWISMYKSWGFELLNIIIVNTTYKGISGTPSIPCSCYSLTGDYIRSFESIAAASVFVKKDKMTITRVCNRTKITAANLQWRFGNSTDNIGTPRKWKLHVPVHQYDLLGNFVATFSSTRSALTSIAEGLSAENIASCLDKPGRHCHGYQWRSYKVESIPPFVRKTVKKCSKGVVAYNKITGEYVGNYPTAVIALSSLGVINGDRSAVYKCCLGKFVSYKGYIWKYQTSL